MRFLIFAVAACCSAQFAATEEECKTFDPIKVPRASMIDGAIGTTALVAAPVAAAGTLALGTTAMLFGPTFAGAALGYGARDLYRKTGRLGAYGLRMLSWSSFQKEALRIVRKALRDCQVDYVHTSDEASLGKYIGWSSYSAFRVAPTCIAQATTTTYGALCSNMEKALLAKVNSNECKGGGDEKSKAEWSVCYLKRRIAQKE